MPYAIDCIATSPCVAIRLPKRSRSAVEEVLTTEQVRNLSGAVPARYAALIITGAGTGLRPGELFGLAMENVDFEAATIRVSQQLVRVRGEGVRVGPLKTQSSYREVPLPSVVADALTQHLRNWEPHRDLGLIFTNDREGPIQQHPFAALWNTAATRLRLPEWASPHDLRHSLPRRCSSGRAVSIKVIQMRLGHASAKTTLDTYGHLFPDEADRTRLAIDEELALSA
ncbi:MAG: site-specific integrase [Acidimicrobiia bacterium]|nr:site-specific integrase [Acidimicrobiia bacterium]